MYILIFLFNFPSQPSLYLKSTGQMSGVRKRENDGLLKRKMSQKVDESPRRLSFSCSILLFVVWASYSEQVWKTGAGFMQCSQRHRECIINTGRYFWCYLYFLLTSSPHLVLGLMLNWSELYSFFICMYVFGGYFGGGSNKCHKMIIGRCWIPLLLYVWEDYILVQVQWFQED